MVSLYFIFLFWVTKPEEPKEDVRHNALQNGSNQDGRDGREERTLPMTKETISYALSAGLCLCLAGDLMSRLAFGGRVSAM